MAQSLLGNRILGYTVEEELGSGSFGKVYRVSKTNPSGRYVRALKHITLPSQQQYYSVLSTMGGDTAKTDNYFQEELKSLISEVKILNKLTDIDAPNIVRYYENDIVESNNPKRYDVFILMEYLTPLDKYVVNNDFTVEDVVKLGLDILRGLESCHNHKIIHRDIKIENIFVTEDKNFKIGDFGVSKILLEQSRAQSVIGTPNFLAPEVYAGAESYSSSVDLYSLGIVLYKLLNYNRNPFLPPYPEQYYAADEQAAFEKRMRGERPNLPAFGGEKIGEVIVKAISGAKERYKDAREFYDALKKAADETSPKVLNTRVSLNELKNSFVKPPVDDNATVLEGFSATETSTYSDGVGNFNSGTVPPGGYTYPPPGYSPQGYPPQGYPQGNYTQTYNESVGMPNMNSSNPGMNQTNDVNQHYFDDIDDMTMGSTGNYYPPSGTGEIPEKKSVSPMMIIIGIILAGVIAAVGLLGYYVLKPEEKVETPPVQTAGAGNTDTGTTGTTNQGTDNTGSGTQTEYVPVYIDSGNSGGSTGTTTPSTTTPTPSTTASNGDYVIPDSNSRYLTEADLVNLSEDQLCLARNEISARHGRKYDTDWIQEYFNSKSWYSPIYGPDEFDSMEGSLMTDLERKNMVTIKNYEQKMGYL